MASADVLLHPVRLRIVQCMLADRALTTADLAAELPDVPPATLYRHVAALVEADVLSVVGQRRVRGAVERRYALNPANATAGRDDVAAMSREQLRTAFGVFIASLLAGFDSYLAGPDVDPAHDALGFRTAAVHLRDDDLAELTERLQAAIDPWRAPRPDARRHLLSTILTPVGGPDAPPDPQQPGTPPRIDPPAEPRDPG
jgi:AcrR family transcriptional regulator